MLSPFDLVAILLTFAALFAFANQRWLHLPQTIALFLLGLVTALALTALDAVTVRFDAGEWLRDIAHQVNLPKVLLEGVLGYLLYAAAVNEDLAAILKRKWTILALATLGVVLSTTVVGVGMWYVFDRIGAGVPLIWCLVLGAAIAPTDPVAVASILERLPVPGALRTVISGESLLNDGVGVVAFTLLLQLAVGGTGRIGGEEVLVAFLREAVGGGLLGLVCGLLAFEAKRRVDESTVELMISLALVTGTFSLARLLEVSGPIAVVVAGLLIGYTTDRHVSSERSRRDLRIFWTMVDAVLNALLFLIVGLEVTVLTAWDRPHLLAALLAIPVALAARLFSLTPAFAMNLGARRKGAALAVLTWAGLRGGIAVALILSLPDTPYREHILAACYAIVAFSIVVQGLSLEPVAKRVFPVREE